MKLYISVNSPYVRLVRVLIREAGAVGAVTEIPVNPKDQSTGFWSVNPVARIPALELDDGTVLTESLLICQHLDARFAGGRFSAPLQADPARLAVLGLAYGALDRGVAARTDQLRAVAPDHPDFVKTQYAAIARSSDALDALARDPQAAPDLADFAVACMAEWVEFRHPSAGILDGRPNLSAWVKAIGARPAMVQTRPVMS